MESTQCQQKTSPASGVEAYWVRWRSRAGRGGGRRLRRSRGQEGGRGVDPDAEAFAEWGCVDYAVAARLARFQRERIWQCRRSRVDADDLVQPVEHQQHRLRIAEPLENVPVEQQIVSRAQAGVQPVLRCRYRAVFEYFPPTEHIIKPPPCIIDGTLSNVQDIFLPFGWNNGRGR